MSFFHYTITTKIPLKRGDFMIIGCHISTKGSLIKMLNSIIDLDLNAFQYFTRNPRGGSVRIYLENEITEYKQILGNSAIKSVAAHLPYTVNLASSTARTRNFGKLVLKEDLKRANDINSNYLVMHPGSYVKNNLEQGINYIVEGLKPVLEDYDGETIICLETMAGKGTEIGRSLDEISEILEKLDWHEKLGVCLDSCHLFAAGYDFNDESEVGRLITDIEKK